MDREAILFMVLISMPKFFRSNPYKKCGKRDFLVFHENPKRAIQLPLLFWFLSHHAPFFYRFLKGLINLSRDPKALQSSKPSLNLLS